MKNLNWRHLDEIFFQNCRRRAGICVILLSAQAHDHSKMMQGAHRDER